MEGKELIVSGCSFNVLDKKIKSAGGQTYRYLRTFVNVGRHPATGRTRQIEVAAATEKELTDKLYALLHFSPEDAGIISTDITFAEWIEKEWDSRCTVLEDNSISGERSIIRRHILPRLGNIRLTEIDETLLIDWQEKKLADGIRNNRVRDIWRVISAYLDLAVKHRYLVYNPCRYSCIVEGDTPERKALDNDTVRRLLVNNDDEILTAFFAVVMLCALRISEALSLVWSDLDFDKRLLTVHAQASYMPGADGKRYIKPYTKNKRPRTILIPESAIWYFIRQRQVQSHRAATENGPGSLIFTGADGEMYNIDTVRRCFKRAIGSNDQGYVMHDLRRTSVSRAVELTGDTETASYYLGHSYITTTYIYLDAGEEASSRVAATVGPEMERLLDAAGLTNLIVSGG